MILLVKLILAHLLGDFFLQPTAWVVLKEQKKLRSVHLYLHAIIHGALALLFVMDWSFLLWALLIAVIHGVIDSLKLVLQTPDTKRRYFFLDQVAHIVSLLFIYCWHEEIYTVDLTFMNEHFFLLVTLLVFLTSPGSYCIKMIIVRWTPYTVESADGSLADAGKFIGIFERLFVFLFVVSGHWEAVGFLLTAKSVFRFGDLRDSKDRKLTEYVLIGTLLSFGIAVLAGLIFVGLV